MKKKRDGCGPRTIISCVIASLLALTCLYNYVFFNNLKTNVRKMEVIQNPQGGAFQIVEEKVFMLNDEDIQDQMIDWGDEQDEEDDDEELNDLAQDKKQNLPRNHLIMDRQYDCPKIEKIGDTEGGWHTCILPTLGKKSVVYSFGLGSDPSFDLTFISKFGGIVHAFDPTPTGEECYESSIHKTDKWIFHSWGLSGADGNMTFLSPKGGHGQYSIKNWDGKYNPDRTIIRPGFRLETIMKKLGHSEIDICKVDIEGSEWGVIDDLAKSTFHAKQLFFEFHFFDLDKTDYYSEKLTAVISKLNALGYKWFHRNDFRTLGNK
eukprot:TRINITY_DN5764_c0_g3_i1.p1 TRINITY_DN5764_c0_g3~~TRINITY_DN5764_c0_g3_i1.p1  ORF type:complete len:320 (+),score=67.36 TRINITY_DN5764_c0_g3_i1:51-1010(+)